MVEYDVNIKTVGNFFFFDKSTDIENIDFFFFMFHTFSCFILRKICHFVKF